MLLDLIAALALAIWFYLLFLRGGFWREFTRPGSSPAKPGASAPRIVAVVPARDEAEVVARSMASLASQRAPGYYHVILVDDHSSDGTAAIAAAVAPGELLTTVAAAPLPAGWKGKLWAVAEGVRHSAPLQPDYLLLTDADIVHAPDTAANLAARAEAEHYDLVSYMATLACQTRAERALVPAFVFFFFLLYPPAWIRNPRRSTAGAAGGCMLIRREMLEQIGGVAAIRNALIDDCALARAVKQAGGRIWLGLDENTISIRPYRTFSEVGRMISRSAFAQLNHSALLLSGTLAGLLLTYLAPPLLTMFAPQPAAGMAALAWLLMSIAYLPALRFYRVGWFAAPFLPLVSFFYGAATLYSAISYWRGAGGEWKGRLQDS
ncbi:MAG TPA: glycosyltransferase [Bryobacteraceae bacterium]|nr:glycosyltransferase [Bryobacteraceae bacterium]